MSLEEKLAKIKSPNLHSQEHTAVVLSSVEDTLTEQGTKFTSTAYFAALLALLRQSVSIKETDANLDLVTPTIYLLEIVSPYVPAPLLRAQFGQILSILTPILSQNEETPALLRSCIGFLESLLVAQDAASWSMPLNQSGPRGALSGILSLAIDPRPKVRKRAQEALAKILQHPPPGPSLDHPAADLCASFALNAVTEAASSNNSLKQRSQHGKYNDAFVIHTLRLAKCVAAASNGWPSKKIGPLCEVLLSLSRSNMDFLVMSAFEVFEVIFSGFVEDVSLSKLPRLLDAIVDLKPTKRDSQLIPPWIAVLSRGYEVFSQVSPGEAFSKLPDLFDLISMFLTSASHNIRVSASECLISFLANCIPPSVVTEPSIYDERVLIQIGEKANGLFAVKYQTAWMEVFATLRALFDALRWRGDPYLLPIVKSIGELRGSDSFQGKKEADEVLGHAIRNLGPELVLSALPLNLINPGANQQGRVWLLPLMRDYVSNTRIAHFKTELIPLSQLMYQKILDNTNTEKTVEIKIFETVIQQIWAILPGYCDVPLDLQSAVDKSFAELISNLLYKEVGLRVSVCKALQSLVESNQAILNSDLSDDVLILERRMTKKDAESNLQHLAEFSKNLLAVLFNVYSQTMSQHRAYILQCVNAYLSISPEKDLLETFNRVMDLLDTSLPDADGPAPRKQAQSADKLPPTSHALLDLVVALSPYLPRAAFATLFSLASRILSNPVVCSSDPQLVKKAYRLIPRLSTSPVGSEALEARNTELQTLLLSTSDKTPVPARRDRLLAIHTIISYLPTSDLHFIPSILSEPVLACKDANEKARQAGFDLLVHITNRIIDSERNPPGTTIRNSLVPHMPKDAPDAVATLDEVFTMVSAGLAGVAPHMVAASISALSRLLFEFYSKLNTDVVEDLVSTVVMFLQSNNREIVRSVLGFVKVCVVILPEEMMRPKMLELVPALMVWSKENKGRLRAKVKSILERCLRKFSAADLEKWVGDSDRKMVVNIRKRKERSKRNRKSGVEEDEESDGATGETNFDNELDEILGSDGDSEMSINDEEGEGGPYSKRSKKKRRPQYIRDDDEDNEPLDLLGPNALASISTQKLVRFTDRNASRKRTKVKMSDGGKLILGVDNDDDDETHVGDGYAGHAGEHSGVNAYLDAVEGADAVHRGQRGRLKVSSGMQKRIREIEKMDLDEDEARQVGVNMKQGSRGAKGKLPKRRGLGGEKLKSGNRRIEKRAKLGAKGGKTGFKGGMGIRR